MEKLIAAENPGVLDEHKIIIKGVAEWMTKKDLLRHFRKFGKVDSVCVKKKELMDTSRLYSYAFVVYVRRKSVETALGKQWHIIRGYQVFPERVVHNVGNQLYVHGVTAEITDENLKTYFGRFGTVTNVHTPYDRDRNQRGSYSFVTFKQKEIVFRLFNSNKVHVINGRELRVWRGHKNMYHPVRDVPLQLGAHNEVTQGVNVSSGYGQFLPSYGYLQAPCPAVLYQPLVVNDFVIAPNGPYTYWNIYAN